MIELKRGDILQEDAEALVNTVNCVGVMGRGIALQFRKAFPENYKAYKAACDRKQVKLGKMFVYELYRMINPHYIINFPTKRHWKGKSRMEDIESGLKSLVVEIRKRKIKSIAIPPLGCGLGGLEWREVRPRIENALRNINGVRVRLYEPKGPPIPEKMSREKKEPRMTKSHAYLLGLMGRYLGAAMDPFITLLEIHKLMYFIQEAGEDLKLKYKKGLYGPYAENLRHVLNRIEGHFIMGYGDSEDNPDKQITLIPKALKAAKAYLEKNPDTCKRFDRVANLIEGFETPYGMELLSTVHWVASREGALNPERVIDLSYLWNPRKRMFSKDHLILAFEILKQKEWLSDK